MEKVLNMTVGELLELGANLDICFHESQNIEEARETIEPFEDIGIVERRNGATAQWLNVGDESLKISVTAFYEDVDHETETARAVLTEQERKMKEAGHKESDFR